MRHVYERKKRQFPSSHGAHLLEEGGVLRERIRLTRRLGLDADGVEVPVAPLELLHRRGEVRDGAGVRQEPLRGALLERDPAPPCAPGSELLDERHHLRRVQALDVAHRGTGVRGADGHEGADPDQLLVHRARERGRVQHVTRQLPGRQASCQRARPLAIRRRETLFRGFFRVKR